MTQLATVSPTRIGGSRLPLIIAGGGSLLEAVLGLRWLLIPGTHPYFPAGPPIDLPSRLPPTVSALTLLILGLAGIIAATLGLLGSRRAATLIAIGEVLVGVVLLSSASVLTFLGYLLAMAIPLAVVVVLALACRRYRIMRFVTPGIVVVVGIWGYAAGTLAPANLTKLIMEIAGGFGNLAPTQLWPLAYAAVSLSWAWVALALSDRRSAEQDLRIARFSVPFTWIAAACPLPYFLMRMTWLTPWHQFGPRDLPADFLLWGVLLGSGALLGSVLTLGLLLRWGSEFPSWIPRLGGRPVPPLVAVIPGSIVAFSLTFAAVPTILQSFGDAPVNVVETLVWNLTFPFWLWGPTLAIAVWGYAARRRSSSSGVTSDHRAAP